MPILIYFLAFVFCYLFGAIPNGVLIGKIFYSVDVRQYGSHNSGGTNAGRVLGKKAGTAVIVLDCLKTVIAFWGVFCLINFTALSTYVEANIAAYIGLVAICLGHCFSPYLKFQGGKAVATFAGCLLCTNWILFLAFVITILIVLKLTKMVSLGSLISSFVTFALSLLLFIPQISQVGMFPLLTFHYTYPLALALCFILLVYRHRANIKRIKNGEESKISWLK